MISKHKIPLVGFEVRILDYIEHYRALIFKDSNIRSRASGYLLHDDLTGGDCAAEWSFCKDVGENLPSADGVLYPRGDSHDEKSALGNSRVAAKYVLYLWLLLLKTV